MKPGPGSRPTLGRLTETRTCDWGLICLKHNESLIDPWAYEFSGGRNFQDYAPFTGIYDPALFPLIDNPPP